MKSSRDGNHGFDILDSYLASIIPRLSQGAKF
jgi:hypothetical protein